MTNADKFKHYERWATASDFPTDNIVNDGSTDHADRLGSVADLALCLRAKKVVEEGSSSQGVLVIAGDMIFQVFIGKFLPAARYEHAGQWVRNGSMTILK